MKMKPPQFDEKIACASYFCQFDTAAKVNGWTSKEKATALTMALRGDATNILQTLSRMEREDYAHLIKRLEMRYKQAHLEQVYHSRLKNRCQKSSETLQEFETDKAGLVRLAYPGISEIIMERLAVQAFLYGLRDPETRQALILARPNKLVDALARALEFEAAKQGARNQARVRQFDEYHDSLEESIRRTIK